MNGLRNSTQLTISSILIQFNTMNIQDYIRRNLSSGTLYGDLLNNESGRFNLESLSPQDKENYNMLKEIDKRKLYNEQQKETQYIVSPTMRHGVLENMGGINGKFQQVM